MKQRTFEILKNFSGINKSCLIREGDVIRIMNPEKTVFAQARVDDVFPREFGVFDLPSLLSAISLFQDAEITYEEDHLLIQEGRRKTRFYYTNTRHIKAAPAGDIKLPPTMMSFLLEKKELEDMLKASSVLKLTNLYITGNKVVCKNADGTGNDYELLIENINVGKDINVEDIQININIDTLKLIPADYDVSVTEKAILFKSTTSELQYVVILNN